MEGRPLVSIALGALSELKEVFGGLGDILRRKREEKIGIQSELAGEIVLAWSRGPQS